MQKQPSITIRVRPQDVVSIQHEGRTVTVKGERILNEFGSFAFEKPLLARLRSIRDDLRFKYEYRSFKLTVTTTEFVDCDEFDKSMPFIGIIKEFKSDSDIDDVASRVEAWLQG